jgi:hypothetical protein
MNDRFFLQSCADFVLTSCQPAVTARRVLHTCTLSSSCTLSFIHGHSFSFGLGNLRLWLQLPSTGVASDSVAGIYRLLQSNYQVDYFFEVQDVRNMELLLCAGEQSAQSSGVRYLSRESFEQATTRL